MHRNTRQPNEPSWVVPARSAVACGAHRNIVARRRIETGAVHEGAIEVVEGLEAGERIVNKGAGFLKDGDRVSVSNSVGGS